MLISLSPSKLLPRTSLPRNTGLDAERISAPLLIEGNAASYFVEGFLLILGLNGLYALVTPFFI